MFVRPAIRVLFCFLLSYYPGEELLSPSCRPRAIAASGLSNLLRRARHALLLRGPLANDSTARILHTLLLGLAAWIIYLAVVDLPTTPAKPGNAALEFFLGLTVSGALVLLHKGLFRAASVVYLCGSWLVFTVLIIFNGGIHSVGAFFYLAISISAAWLLGYGAALVTAAVCLASSLTMAVLEVNGFPMPMYFPGKPFGTFNALVGAMVISAVPVARVLRILKEALARSREAEAEVRKHWGALRESEERFRRVFEEGPLGIALVGRDYRIAKGNRALCQMLGYSEAELIQLAIRDVTHPDDLRSDVEFTERLFRGEIPSFRLQKRLVKKNGAIIWVNLTRSVIRGQAGEPLYGLCMVEDITEVKRTQEEALARQKLESLGVLAEGIAHDFNNLLGAVLAQAEVAEADMATGLVPHEEIGRIKAVAIRGAEIVRGMMIYAGRGQSTEVELVDLSRLVEEMIELLKISVSKNVVLKVNLDKKLPPVWGNAPQIRQVVMNLVINASDAIGDKEGAIQVSTFRVTGGRGPTINAARSLPAGDCVLLNVSDTGCGMTGETRAQIFDPFFSTKFAGRGLGLAVVQGIVLGHEGAIDVVSAPGQGATFQVLLPCASERALEIPNAIISRMEKSSARSGTILVVEDEEVLRLAVSKALRKSGFSVLEGGDGTAAMDLFHGHRDEIDVVLLDLTLPGRSSKEVLEEALRVRPDLRVILTSAYSKEMVDVSFNGPRSMHFIRKPFQLGELERVLRDALSA